MAATVTQGIRGTQILSTETRRVRDVTPSLIQLEPDAAPLVTLLAKLRKRQTDDPKIEWFEDELLPRWDLLNAAISDTSGTTITVTNYKYFRKGDLVQVVDASTGARGEVLYVATTPTSTTVTVIRGFGETAAATAASGDKLHILSNTSEEGATSRDLLSTQRAPKFNYCQIFRDPFGFTNTQRGTKQFAGQDEDAERAKQLIEHKKSIEQAILFGERAENTAGTHPKRSTRGILKWITTNVKSVANLSEPEFEAWLRRCFRYGSKEKVVLCSSKVITVINSFGREKLDTRSDDSTYGITMSVYKNAGRRVMLVEHPLFENDSLEDLKGIAGYAFCLDIGDLELRYMAGRMTKLIQNIQANDEDSKKEEHLSEVGLECHQERKHGHLNGVEQ